MHDCAQRSIVGADRSSLLDRRPSAPTSRTFLRLNVDRTPRSQRIAAGLAQQAVSGEESHPSSSDRLVRRLGVRAAPRKLRMRGRRRQRAPHPGESSTASGRSSASASLLAATELRPGRDLHALCISPQSFEAVKLTRARRKNVNDEVEVIKKHPIGLLVTFHVCGFGSC